MIIKTTKAEIRKLIKEELSRNYGMIQFCGLINEDSLNSNNYLQIDSVELKNWMQNKYGLYVEDLDCEMQRSASGFGGGKYYPEKDAYSQMYIRFENNEFDGRYDIELLHKFEQEISSCKWVDFVKVGEGFCEIHFIGEYNSELLTVELS